jgi:hypothetical protein
MVADIQERANDLDLTPLEYINCGYGGIFIFKNQSLAADEVERLRKYFANKAKKEGSEMSVLGKKAKKVFKGTEPAFKALDEIGMQEWEERNAAKEQTESSKAPQLQGEAPKRGRGRPKKGDGIPF